MSRETYPYNATNYKIWFSLYFLLLFWSYEHFLPKEILHPVSFTGVPLRRSLRPPFYIPACSRRQAKTYKGGDGKFVSNPKRDSIEVGNISNNFLKCLVTPTIYLVVWKCSSCRAHDLFWSGWKNYLDTFLRKKMESCQFWLCLFWGGFDPNNVKNVFIFHPCIY